MGYFLCIVCFGFLLLDGLLVTLVESVLGAIADFYGLIKKITANCLDESVVGMIERVADRVGNVLRLLSQRLDTVR